jgi:hypothetical protein
MKRQFETPDRGGIRWRTILILQNGWKETKMVRMGSEEAAIVYAKQWMQRDDTTRVRVFDGRAFRSPVIFDSNNLEKPKP